MTKPKQTPIEQAREKLAEAHSLLFDNANTFEGRVAYGLVRASMAFLDDLISLDKPPKGKK